MSSAAAGVSRSSTSLLNKRVPANPRYRHVKATVDSGSSITKYMQKIEEIRKNYRYKKNELFKRMKISTFVQLVVQVAQYEMQQTTARQNECYSSEKGTDRPDTTDLEVQQIQEGRNISSPSLAVTEDDFGSTLETTRSTLECVIKGIGEIDLENLPTGASVSLVDDTSPYLLLDIRDKDAYDQCHIITAQTFPIAMLSRSINSESKQLLAYKNKSGKIILLYDYDEKIAPRAASTLVERGYDNLFMLSGGLKLGYRLFPEGLVTGVPPPSSKPNFQSSVVKDLANQHFFTSSDLEKLEIYLDSALKDNSVGSRLSKASTSASRVSISSANSPAAKDPIPGRPPFRA